MATVLVVDDEFGITELFDAILSDEGHRVLTAIDGRHGLELLGQDLAQLVFLDYMMPVMDGAAMLRAMAADPGMRELPVVMMSSMPESTVAERCSGYAAFLRKPFKVVQVLTLTQRLLEKPAPIEGWNREEPRA
jgi:CheY-like chemotaxis protein